MLSLIGVVLLGIPSQVAARDSGLDKLFRAIRQVETGSEVHPHNAIGDGGKSLGPYQISQKYLTDSEVGGDWRRCRDRQYSEAVMIAYWKRHCPDALRTLDYQTLARIHNGGPNGPRKTATLSYWRLVQAALRSDQSALRSKVNGSRRRSRALAMPCLC